MLDEQTTHHNRSPGQTAGEIARPVADRAGEVAQTAKQEAKSVAQEAGFQARRAAADAKDRIAEQARGQQEQLAEKVRGAAGQLREMAQDKAHTPVGTAVNKLADRGEHLAEYLRTNGPEGLVTEVQQFARRRPGAFLLTAAAAGFVLGRLAKGIVATQRENSTPATSGVPTYPATGMSTAAYVEPVTYTDPMPYTDTAPYTPPATFVEPSATSIGTEPLPPPTTGGSTYVSGQPYPVDEDPTRPGGAP